MKANGSAKPDAFTLEEIPNEEGRMLATFRENIAESQNENKETVYTYDEYQLPLAAENELRDKIEANYDIYLLSAKGRDAWMQMNNILENKIS